MLSRCAGPANELAPDIALAARRLAQPHRRAGTLPQCVKMLTVMIGAEAALKRNEIAGLLGPFLGTPLPEACLAQISTYIDLLIRWNTRVNLTAIRDPREIVTRHFGESFFLARHLLPMPGGEYSVSPTSSLALRVVDIGSGAGFPGLPLKIWAPGVCLTLVESNHKKGAFLREVVRALTLSDVNVLTERAEDLVEGQPTSRIRPPAQSPVQAADLVTFRAVERFEATLSTAVRLVAPGGRVAVLIGASQARPLSAHAEGVRWNAPIAVPLSHSRVVSIGVMA